MLVKLDKFEYAGETGQNILEFRNIFTLTLTELNEKIVIKAPGELYENLTSTYSHRTVTVIKTPILSENLQFPLIIKN